MAVKFESSKINNATIACFGMVAVWDLEAVDDKCGIWKGKVMLDKNAPPGMDNNTTIFISRLYKEDNDQDRMLQEYEIVDESIKGVPFVLVPRDKILFIYEKPSNIVIPPIKIQKRMGM